MNNNETKYDRKCERRYFCFNWPVDHPWISPRIINGMDAVDGQAPYQCSMQKNSSHFCGCAIISSDWVLTAAHCLLNENVNDIEILVGTNQWNAGGERYKIRSTVVHEKYDRAKHLNDIALVHVKTSIAFSEKVQPINYSAKEVLPGSNVMMTGWGRLYSWVNLINFLILINKYWHLTNCKFVGWCSQTRQSASVEYYSNFQRRMSIFRL